MIFGAWFIFLVLHPALLLRELLTLVMVRSSPRVLATHLLSMHRPSSCIWLVADENVAELEDAVDIFWRLDDSLVLEHRRDERMREAAAGRIWLLRKEGGVLR